MSHTTKIKSVPIKDVSAMHKAAQNLNAKGIDCSILTNAKPRMHLSDQPPVCDYVLKLSKGQYDVGFQLQKDGTYMPILDTYGSHVGRQLGAACPMPNTAEGRAQHQMGQFLQEYAKEAAINSATAAGYMVESADLDAEGNVQLVMSGM